MRRLKKLKYSKQLKERPKVGSILENDNEQENNAKFITLARKKIDNN